MIKPTTQHWTVISWLHERTTPFLIGLLLWSGCGIPQVFGDEPDRQRVEAFDELEQKSVTNIKRRPADQKRRPTRPPAYSRDQSQITLTDLGIVLRKVNFQKPIDKQTAIFFSDTEVTNEAFAAYLNDTINGGTTRSWNRSRPNPGKGLRLPTAR